MSHAGTARKPTVHPRSFSNMQSKIWRTIPMLRNPIFVSQFHSTSILLAKSTNDKDLNFNRHDNETNKGKGKAQGPEKGCTYNKSQSSFEKGKRNSRRPRQRFYDTDDEAGLENFSNATFGGQKCYTWSFTWSFIWSFTWTENLGFSNIRSGFNYENDSSRKEKAREKFWRESDDDEESTNIYSVGSFSHRKTLGLPPTGPLKLEDIKTAYRASALKWHPDKHRGASQAMAEEKFKLCVDAYNSLCNEVKAT